jgi:predicted metalloendopeptidase
MGRREGQGKAAGTINAAATIGHEISHGFDDQGSQYDSDGNLRDWWTPADQRFYIGFAQRCGSSLNMTYSS